jgi:hypothetical protein
MRKSMMKREKLNGKEKKRKVQGEIKGETVGLISQRPSDLNGPDGPPLPRALIGGAPAR